MLYQVGELESSKSEFGKGEDYYRRGQMACENELTGHVCVGATVHSIDDHLAVEVERKRVRSDCGKVEDKLADPQVQ